MAASELSTAAEQRTGGRSLTAELAVAWLYAYAGVWSASLAGWALVQGAGQPAISITRRVLRLGLTAQRNPPPHPGHIIALAAHNIPIATWPVLIGVTGADRHRLGRHLADWAVLACILVNAAPVGAALAAYGTRLIAYVPQLPLEWAGLALGASSWLVQRRRLLSTRQRLLWLGLTAGVLLCAAVLETVMVPHR
jgi:hypothetical protein